jgi:phage tail-like protein
LAATVPAFLQDDQFLVRLTAGLDEVLAPVISVLDCLDAYVDPRLAPDDFVEWLGAWVGAPLDDHWADDRRRAAVLASATLHHLRGTVEGLRALVELATGCPVDVLEPGGVSVSQSPGESTAESPWLVVRVHADPDPSSEPLRLAVLEELVSAAKPAHVPHTIEVVPR